MPAKTLRDLFIDELKDVYDAEQRLIKALPKMAKAASSDELVSAFENHLRQTEEQVKRIERVFETIDESPSRKTCKAMVGLLEEGEELMKEEGPPSLRDAALIAAAQKVEHYEIATYGCLRTWAEQLDESDCVKLLQKTLDEEAETDETLSEIAQSLNAEAAEGEEDEEGKRSVTVPARRTGNDRSTGTKPRSR
jgi:ferritin-like metal-binding protein YciE